MYYKLNKNALLYIEQNITWRHKSYNYSYAYNHNGIRISKTVNDTTHIYFTEGSRIRAEKRGSDVLTYIYDVSGITGLRISPSGTFSSASYFFLKNQQGDVKFIVDGNGNTLNEYVYDAWGNHKIYKYLNGTILTDSSESPIDISHNPDYTNDIGNLNPFRYRSYYFDAETGWYYLNSRYYDPQIRRFLNADDPSVPLSDQATLFGGLNLYSYCLNNPVNMIDSTGQFALSIFLACLVGGAILGGVTRGINAYNDGARGWELVGQIAIGIGSGALIGSAVGVVAGLGGAYLAGGISSIFSKFTTDLVAYSIYGTPIGTWEDYAIAFAIWRIHTRTLWQRP